MNPTTDQLLAHRDFVMRLACHLLRDTHEAEDLAQDTMVAALDAPEPPRRMRPWLASVARRLAMRHRRREARRVRRERASARSGATSSTEQVAARLEMQRRLVEAVGSLAEPYRTVVVLRFYEGLKPREIARRLGVPVETVRTRIRRGLTLLRRVRDSWPYSVGEMLEGIHDLRVMEAFVSYGGDDV